MKLHEIANPVIHTKSTQTTLRSYRDEVEDDQSISAGSYGFVRPVRHDPHVIQKLDIDVMDGNFGDDPFLRYIEAIIDLSGENPYVPVVHRVKRLTNATNPKARRGVYRNSYVIEKLVDHYDLKKEFDNSYHKELDPYDMLRHQWEVMFYPSAGVDSWDKMCQVMRKAIVRDDYDRIQDDRLADVLSIINQLYTDPAYDCIVDLHPGNCMIRRGRTGLQVVITDPLT